MPLADLILLLSGLLTVAMLAASLGRRLPVPHTVLLVILGILLSTAANHYPPLESVGNFSLTPDLVFFVFLPALVFESALNLDARQLLKDLAPILALAVPALLLSMAVIGIGMWAYLELPLAVALLFGALIAATDPVAVVALFKELGAPARLTTLVEGESLLNDATAIVLFHILLGIALAGEFAVGNVGHAAIDFVRVFIGGVLIGLLVGLGISELMRRIHGGEHAMLVMSLVMAYASFALAEHVFHVSGVMATVSAAVAMGAYAVTRIRQESVQLIREVWEVIAVVCNALLFLMIGLSVDLNVIFAAWDGVLIAVLLVVVARAASIYSLVPAAVRVFKLPKVSMGERHIMWWGGLKGGLAIAIVLAIPEDLADRQMLIELTLGVVLFTLLVNAPTIRPLIRALGIDRMTSDEVAEFKHGLLDAKQSANAILKRLDDADLLEPAVSNDITESVNAAFDETTLPTSRYNAKRATEIEALKVEQEALENLFQLGLVEEYTYLDLRGRIRRDCEAIAGVDEFDLDDQSTNQNPFVAMERTALRKLREQNWLAPVLARYQRARLSAGVQRDLTGILCGQAVCDELPKRSGMDKAHVDAVCARYRDRVQRRRARAASVARDFPEFFASLQTRLYQYAVFCNAEKNLERRHHHAEIGAKAYTQLSRLIENARRSIVMVVNPAGNLTSLELIEQIPLFFGLSPTVHQRLSELAQAVTFLEDDIVIAEHEKGNALYIISQGTVDVTRTGADGQDSPVAKLVPGDFFGEAALLGDEVRTATVKATSSLKLLRITRRHVEVLANEDNQLKERLQAANDSRKSEFPG